MTDKVGKLQRASLRDPVRVSTRKSKYQSVTNLRQFVHLVPQDELDTYVVYLLRVALMSAIPGPGLDVIRLSPTPADELAASSNDSIAMTGSAIVFTRTREASNRLALVLRQFITAPVVALNGDMPQAQRIGALNKFKKSQGAVLVATDVASRGLDIPQVGLVINYDVPLEAKTYMHRVGRTARAGRVGCALTLVTQYSVVFFLKEIEAHLLQSSGDNQQRIPALLPPGDSVNEAAIEAAVELLNVEVKEAAVKAARAVERLFKQHKGRFHSSDAYTSVNDMLTSTPGLSVTGPNTSTGDVKSASASAALDEITAKPGLRRTAWASEAPLACQQKIAAVMRAMHVPGAVSADAMDTGDGADSVTASAAEAREDPKVAEHYANLSRAFAKRKTVKAKRRQAREDKQSGLKKCGSGGRGGGGRGGGVMKSFKRR